MYHLSYTLTIKPGLMRNTIMLLCIVMLSAIHWSCKKDKAEVSSVLVETEDPVIVEAKNFFMPKR